MNKTKIILAATGGAIGLAILVMAVFVWLAFSEKSANLEGSTDDPENEIVGLEEVRDKANTLSHKPVYPCADSVKAIESNRTQVVEWKSDALKLAARGDRIFEATTPPAFKTFIVKDAKRLAELPGGVSGKIMKPDFAFGPFKDYIAEGKMPEIDRLAVLQRQWDDVATMIELLAGAGISEFTDVALKVPEAPSQETSDRGRQKVKRQPPKKKGAPEEKKPVSYTYEISFSASPAALVKGVNAFETAERFLVVENFSIVREKDALSEALGGEKKETPSAQSGGRRRRRVEVQETKAEAKEEKNGVVTDPQREAPMKVSMTVSIYDFRSLEDAKGDANGEEVKK